jgi:hypothetical protein
MPTCPPAVVSHHLTLQCVVASPHPEPPALSPPIAEPLQYTRPSRSVPWKAQCIPPSLMMLAPWPVESSARPPSSFSSSLLCPVLPLPTAAHHDAVSKLLPASMRSTRRFLPLLVHAWTSSRPLRRHVCCHVPACHVAALRCPSLHVVCAPTAASLW